MHIQNRTELNNSGDIYRWRHIKEKTRKKWRNFSKKRDFEITVEENPENFLEIKCEKSEGKVKLTQEDYARQILETYGMQNSKSAGTPMALDKV